MLEKNCFSHFVTWYGHLLEIIVARDCFTLIRTVGTACSVLLCMIFWIFRHGFPKQFFRLWTTVLGLWTTSFSAQYFFSTQGLSAHHHGLNCDAVVHTTKSETGNPLLYIVYNKVPMTKNKQILVAAILLEWNLVVHIEVGGFFDTHISIQESGSIFFVRIVKYIPTHVRKIKRLCFFKKWCIQQLCCSYQVLKTLWCGTMNKDWYDNSILEISAMKKIDAFQFHGFLNKKMISHHP